MRIFFNVLHIIGLALSRLVSSRGGRLCFVIPYVIYLYLPLGVSFSGRSSSSVIFMVVCGLVRKFM